MAQKDPDARRAYARAWYEQNKGRIRPKIAARVKERRQQNLEADRAYHREWERQNREKNRDAVNAKQRERYAANKEKRQAQNRASYAKHAEKRRDEVREKRKDPAVAALHVERQRVSRAKHAEEHRRKQRERNAANPFPHREAQRKRRAIKRNAPDGGLTKSEWDAILEYHDHRCAYCLQRLDDLQVDHVIALVRGGEHSADNVVPACAPCNGSKNDRSLLEIFSGRLLVAQRMRA